MQNLLSKKRQQGGGETFSEGKGKAQKIEGGSRLKRSRKILHLVSLLTSEKRPGRKMQLNIGTSYGEDCSGSMNEGGHPVVNGLKKIAGGERPMGEERTMATPSVKLKHVQLPGKTRGGKRTEP